MTLSTSFPSIHADVPPLEEGGVRARDGFYFQDHVAVRFCLEMVSDPCLKEVRCETHDDITLIWYINQCDEVEFVQVKGNQLSHLWSLAELCKRERKIVGSDNKPLKEGSSIIEKSLSNDRFVEPSRFRIVTRLDVNDELDILKLPLSSPKRNLTDASYRKLCNELNSRVNGYCSPKGNDGSYWGAHAVWDVEHEEDVLALKNRTTLRRIIEDRWDYLTDGQIDKVYCELLNIVQTAARADWKRNPEAKKIKRDNFLVTLKRIVSDVRDALITPVGRKMQEKMEVAHIPSEYITKAHKMREYFRIEFLNPKYTGESSFNSVEMEIHAVLQGLLSKLDTDKIMGSGLEFHDLCLEKLRELRDSLQQERKIDLAFLYGCMYYITGRCDHRFKRLHDEIYTES